MPVNVKQFKRYFVPISNDAKKNDRRRPHAWIAPALYNTLRFINCPLFLEGDGTSHNERDLAGRQPSVRFVQKLYRESISDWKQGDGMYVTTLQNIGKEKETFVDWWSTYHSKSTP